MKKLIGNFGLLSGLIGALFCLVAVIGRISGYFYIYSFEALTLLFVGIAAMVFACMIKLYNQ